MRGLDNDNHSEITKETNYGIFHEVKFFKILILLEFNKLFNWVSEKIKNWIE